MAGEMWNRVNIPFPSAVSSARVPFSSTTDANVKTLLVENEKVLTLIRSVILETEIRVLYELMYNLNNSFRGNKTFKGLKQVEQCIHRLKSMKLDVALQGLKELCPNRMKRGLSIKIGEGDVPSQPFLEWLCLKVLGGAQLMSCTLDRCSRAFVSSKQQMKLEMFIIVHVVISSMLSRLSVIFRGILVSLSTLYQRLLELLREVASAQSMPFLTDFSLPADMTQFLGLPPEILPLTKLSAHIPHGGEQGKRRRRNKKCPVKVKNQERTKKVKEDVGVAVERGRALDTDLEPFLSVLRNFTAGKRPPQETHRTAKKDAFKKRVRAAKTVTDMMTRLKERIRWCRSQKMKKEQCLLTSLCFKCLRMKCLEAAGYNVERKLQNVRLKALGALSPQGSVPRARRSYVVTRSKARQINRFPSLRSRWKSSAVRSGVKSKRRKRTESSVSPLSGDGRKHRTARTVMSPTTCNDGHDDIDDIFASVGL